MRIALLLSFILAVSQVSAQTPSTQKPAQTPAPPPKTATPPAQPAPAPPKTTTPAKPAPAPSTTPQTRRPAATTRGGIAITATSPQGATLPGVRVTISGATERSDQTDASGQLTFPSLLTGTYRLRFESEKVTTFEKEVSVQNGRVTDV